MFSRLRFVLLPLALLCVSAFGQEGFSLFTTDFPPEEFAARRAEVFKAIGETGLALLQGAPSPTGYTRFRQSNEFYYLCGIEIPHAYLLLDGSMKRASLYLPHRNEARERGEGKLLSAEDAELVKNLSGVNEVFGTDLLVEHLARATRISGRAIFTPFSPAEGFAMSRDLAVRVIGDYAADPFDGRPSREGALIQTLRGRFPQFEIRDLSPTLVTAGYDGKPDT
ncbi:MAG TPA: aminopeptidase P N-terminal domain-containing protein, partial [Blastocatellia bacterium]|nr:aminopeptidase P N-terminal domain-containing protein [Blastocatellia bacterium]